MIRDAFFYVCRSEFQTLLTQSLPHGMAQFASLGELLPAQVQRASFCLGGSTKISLESCLNVHRVFFRAVHTDSGYCCQHRKRLLRCPFCFWASHFRITYWIVFFVSLLWVSHWLCLRTYTVFILWTFIVRIVGVFLFFVFANARGTIQTIF